MNGRRKMIMGDLVMATTIGCAAFISILFFCIVFGVIFFIFTSYFLN